MLTDCRRHRNYRSIRGFASWCNVYQRQGDCFLLVLVKGDLREYESRMPSLHLHRINTAKLGHLSALAVESVKGAIVEHLVGLFRTSQGPAAG